MKSFLSILRVKLRNIFGHKNPAYGTFGYFFQLWTHVGRSTASSNQKKKRKKGILIFMALEWPESFKLLVLISALNLFDMNDTNI